MREFLEAIKSFTWPLAFLIFAIVFLFLFRREIGAFILRVRHVSRLGIEAVGPEIPSAQRQETPSPRPEEELIRALDSPVLREVEENIKKDFQSRGLSNSQSVNVLLRYFAAITLAYTFEVLYQNIWGSQIAILQFLNPLEAGAAVSFLEPFYSGAAQQYPDVFRPYPFGSYLQFLESRSLISRAGDTVSITKYGREFLTYLIREGKNPVKPF